MLRKRKEIVAVAILFVVAACILLLLKDGGKVQEKQEGTLQVRLLKVGKADAIVLQSGDKTMVIDTGEEEDGEELADFLKSREVPYVDTLIITHFDKDHVGGADALIDKMEIREVLIPDYQGSNTEYLDFIEAMEQKKIVPHKLTETVKFEFGEASVMVEPPHSYIAEGSGEPDNNFSLITTVVHGDNRFLFMGDAEKHRIREWLSSMSSEGCDFLKMPHHGVYNKALKELLDAASPKYAAICSSKKNPAEIKTLELLREKNVQTFQTKDGDITVLSDGERLECTQER